MNICVFGASSNDIDRAYIEAGEVLGRAMAEKGHGLIFGGGRTGLMGAVARGMDEKGGVSIGIAPAFFNKPGVLFEKCTEFYICLLYTSHHGFHKVICRHVVLMV